MFNKCFLATAAVLAVMAPALPAQQPAPAPAFEVATIKPAPPLDRAKIAAGQIHIGMKTDAGRVDIGFFSLADLIRTAYRIKPYQLSAPDWLSSERWDVQAKIPDGASQDQVPEMLQALLAERFKLAVHRTGTEHSVYALVAGKNVEKLKEAVPDPVKPQAPAGPDGASALPAPAGGRGMVIGSGENQVRVTPNPAGRGATVSSPKFGQMKMSMGEGGVMRMEFSKMKMADFADVLSRFVDRPVLDMTGLKGSYQVALDLSMEDMRQVAMASGMGGMGMMMGPRAGGGEGARPPAAPAEAASNPGGSIFAAVDRLGLKLDPRKAPLEMIVVDHVEKAPTEN